MFLQRKLIRRWNFARNLTTLLHTCGPSNLKFLKIDKGHRCDNTICYCLRISVIHVRAIVLYMVPHERPYIQLFATQTVNLTVPRNVCGTFWVVVHFILRSSLHLIYNLKFWCMEISVGLLERCENDFYVLYSSTVMPLSTHSATTLDMRDGKWWLTIFCIFWHCFVHCTAERDNCMTRTRLDIILFAPIYDAYVR